MDGMPNVMRGLQLTGHGGLDKLVLRYDIPVPVSGPRDVLIKISAAGVNNTDINTRIGWYSKSNGNSEDAGWAGNPIQLPRIQGADVCGKVVAVGERVDASLLNERVLVEPCILEAGGEVLDQPWYFGSECDGGFAEYTVVAARHAHKINSKLSDIELASLPSSTSESL
ncbi:MAG: alcohol dehydrogenase catalytic domain-containing protein [Taibaiella sp.]|nr:alcohol dehydrogenase catalytic domain-containing protein [Taibaiella sp.]